MLEDQTYTQTNTRENMKKKWIETVFPPLSYNHVRERVRLCASDEWRKTKTGLRLDMLYFKKRMHSVRINKKLSSS